MLERNQLLKMGKQVTKESELLILINEFTKLNVINRELACKISFFSKNLCPTMKEPEILLKEQQNIGGFVGLLSEQLNFLRRTNEDLNAVAEHLESVIGS